MRTKSEQHEYYLANRDVILARNRRWSEANRERHQELARSWHYRNPDKVKIGRLRLTQEEYDDRLAMQGGVCAICKQPETALSNTGKVRRLAADHNHETGEERGLLCHRCNVMIGFVETRLNAVNAYLGVTWT